MTRTRVGCPVCAVCAALPFLERAYPLVMGAGRRGQPPRLPLVWRLRIATAWRDHLGTLWCAYMDQARFATGDAAALGTGVRYGFRKALRAHDRMFAGELGERVAEVMISGRLPDVWPVVVPPTLNESSRALSAVHSRLARQSPLAVLEADAPLVAAGLASLPTDMLADETVFSMLCYMLGAMLPRPGLQASQRRVVNARLDLLAGAIADVQAMRERGGTAPRRAGGMAHFLVAFAGTVPARRGSTREHSRDWFLRSVARELGCVIGQKEGDDV